MTSTRSLTEPPPAALAERGDHAHPLVMDARFRAMGSDAHITVVGGPPHLLERARRRIVELESRWSRFAPTSEVSRLNASKGRPVRVSTDTALLVDRAKEAWALTGGSFDPTVLRALEAAGYDRSFELIGDGHPSRSVRRTHPGSTSDGLAGCTDIEIARHPQAHPAIGAMVRLPEGCGFDAGGIGKGLAADLVVDELMASGAAGALVNLGGDLRVEGDSPDGLGWLVAVEHPHADRPLAVLSIDSGGVATSTTLRRRWTSPGPAPGSPDAHHLIDPATGTPSTTDVELAVVVAGAAWRAEVLAKAALLRGAQRSFDLIDDRTAAAMIVTTNGVIATTDNFADYAADQPTDVAVRRSGVNERTQP